MEVRTINPTDCAYIAGLVDGEGTVTLVRKHRNENRQLSLSISSTERHLLEFVKDTVGAGKITTKRIARQHHSPSFTYAIYNRQAIALLRQICRFLRGYKAQRAELILNCYLAVTPRNGKYSDELRERKTAFEAAVLEIVANHPGTEQPEAEGASLDPIAPSGC